MLKFKRVGSHSYPLPSRATPQSAGLDLRTPVDLRLGVGDRAVVRTGWVVEIPDGYVGTIRPRGSVSEAGLHVYLGTVDADYKGELLFVVQNLSSQPLEYRAGARIAQIVISKCELLEPMEVEIYRLRLD